MLERRGRSRRIVKTLDETPVQFEESTHKSWMFPRIPKLSQKASEWDTRKGAHSELTICMDNDGLIKLKVVSGKTTLFFDVANVKRVIDSSRYYYVYTDGEEPTRVGIGFDTREASTAFQDAIVRAILCQSKAVRGGITTKYDNLPASQRFFYGPIPETCRIEEGFYDPGQQVNDEEFPSLATLAKQPVNDEKEVLIIDQKDDPRLSRILSASKQKLTQFSNLPDKIKFLALLVSFICNLT
eukprot:TRINITY_DN7522_c0_g1_i1.p1 TRINITY_DN7522_c0_g1~~TRINITY_DN7522_c0_g1_i1.p1  ORF type:complete len:241 (+),score=39.19 TRINITY_DN7522_c0_g1_i1:448-1170(+)